VSYSLCISWIKLRQSHRHRKHRPLSIVATNNIYCQCLYRIWCANINLDNGTRVLREVVDVLGQFYNNNITAQRYVVVCGERIDNLTLSIGLPHCTCVYTKENFAHTWILSLFIYLFIIIICCCCRVFHTGQLFSVYIVHRVMGRLKSLKTFCAVHKNV